MAVRPCSSRSNTVPPTSTWNWLPKFSAIAAVSHGVAMSSDIGPLANSNHSPPAARTKIVATAAMPMPNQRMRRDRIARSTGPANRIAMRHHSAAPARPGTQSDSADRPIGSTTAAGPRPAPPAVERAATASAPRRM